MKRLVLVSCLGLLCVFSKAQSAEAEQLLLDWQKLAQFKKLLQDMHDGYKILYGGYTAIRTISQVSFDLHKNFLDALMEVSPFVKKYKRIADIIECHEKMIAECKSAVCEFKADKNLSAWEVDYISKLYSSLLERSVKSLDELIMITASGSLRMSDDERLQAIDRIYTSVLDQLSFLRDFNNNAIILSAQRKKEQTQIDISGLLNK